ncbi:hypothetical protein NDU88_006069 [Pleurodeles waltl]|uniref:Uncharacterized protein n=1 Tax=Pleurodeles waltl TaxID=8319 RepID=A0AAV7X0F6_PLEWA|nr:hypothetical protein NDU88_006069 [Pleurodeles waltl]
MVPGINLCRGGLNSTGWGRLTRDWREGQAVSGERRQIGKRLASGGSEGGRGAGRRGLAADVGREAADERGALLSRSISRSSCPGLAGRDCGPRAPHRSTAGASTASSLNVKQSPCQAYADRAGHWSFDVVLTVKSRNVKMTEQSTCF